MPSKYMTSNDDALQRIILYVLDAIFTAYGGYFLIQVTRSGGESPINFAAAIPLLASAFAFSVAAVLSHRMPVRATQVAFVASGLAGLALLATVFFVMGIFVIVAFLSPAYVLALLYPYTLVLVTVMYGRWERTSKTGLEDTPGPFSWLKSSSDARAERVMVIVIFLWSIAIFILRR